MVARLAVVVASLAFAVPAGAEELNPDQARRFVAGKTFAFSCFEGSKGAGRIQADGSVTGTIQLQGRGPQRFAALPAGTLQVKGPKICAAMKGLMFEPCFDLQRTSANSFRGSLAGFSFAYCDFNRHAPRRGRMLRTAGRDREVPLALRSSLDR